MKVRLLKIETPAEHPPEYDVRVDLDLDGVASSHTIHVRPLGLKGYDAKLLSASNELQEVFSQEQRTLHRLCRLVGEELKGHPVRSASSPKRLQPTTSF